MSSEKTINLTVNGKAISASVEPRLTLADFLRCQPKLTGTHVGCEHGVCGACTILVDGEAVRSCLIFAIQLDGSEVITVEGLAEDGQLNKLQKSFKCHHALQCGFCTPGMLITATALYKKCPAPNKDQIRDAISGNLCRCTGYIPIVEAIHSAAPNSI